MGLVYWCLFFVVFFLVSIGIDLIKKVEFVVVDGFDGDEDVEGNMVILVSVFCEDGVVVCLVLIGIVDMGFCCLLVVFLIL